VQFRMVYCHLHSPKLLIPKHHHNHLYYTTATTHNTTTVLRPFVRTTRVSQYQKKHSPTQHPDHHPIFISFFHLPRSIDTSLFKLRAWQSFCTTSFHVLFGLPLGMEPFTSYYCYLILILLVPPASFYSYHTGQPAIAGTLSKEKRDFCCSIVLLTICPC